jgi:hypothetical protein
MIGQGVCGRHHWSSFSPAVAQCNVESTGIGVRNTELRRVTIYAYVSGREERCRPYVEILVFP